MPYIFKIFFFAKGWLLFLLVNAYYGGALTMFFSSSPIFPFRTMKQVVLTDYFVEKYFKLFCFIYQALALYPKWKMILTEGDQLSIEERAKAGDDLLMEQWRRVEAGGGDGEINYPFPKTFGQEFFLNFPIDKLLGNHEESLQKLLSEPGFYLYGSKFPIDV